MDNLSRLRGMMRDAHFTQEDIEAMCIAVRDLPLFKLQTEDEIMAEIESVFYEYLHILPSQKDNPFLN